MGEDYLLIKTKSKTAVSVFMTAQFVVQALSKTEESSLFVKPMVKMVNTLHFTV